MSIDSPSRVSLEIHVEEEPEPASASQIRGGLRISVDGHRLNAYRDEERHAWQEWEPEYAGDLLVVDLGRLYDALSAISAGETSIYETEEVRFGGTRRYLVIERLSDDLVRLAFRVYPDRDGSTDVGARLVSERGYLVGLDELVREATRCGEEVLESAAGMGHDLGDAPLQNVRQSIERLGDAD